MKSNWILGLFLLIIGFIWIFINLFLGILIILTGALLIPPHFKKIEHRLRSKPKL